MSIGAFLFENYMKPVLIDGSIFPPLFNEVRKVKETLKTYCLPGDAIPSPKQNLRYAIEQTYGVTVDIRLVPLETPLLRGLIEIYDKRSMIYIDSGLNSQWTRYVFAKEISHHLLHQDEYFSLNIMSTIDYIILDEREIDGDAVHPSKDIQAEMITKFSAMEFVFPYEFREISKAEIASGKTTAFAVAAHFDIPEHIVQYALSDKYMEYAKRVWAEIH